MKFRNDFGKEALSNRLEGASPASKFSGNGVTVGNDNATYRYTIKNTFDEPKVIALNIGYLSPDRVKTPTGASVDGVLAEGLIVGDADTAASESVSARSDNGNIDDFVNFCKLNPVAMKSLKLRVDDAVQFEEGITVQGISPFRTKDSSTIVPSVYKTPDQSNDKLVEIPLKGMQIDNQTVVCVTIGAGREVSFTWFIQAVNNSAEDLRAWLAK